MQAPDQGARGGASVEHGQEPCPDRILDDMGGAFGMGAVGGGIWHLLKGMKNSPRNARMRGGLEAVRRDAPRLGGSFAVWGGLFSTFSCSLVAIRHKVQIDVAGDVWTRRKLWPLFWEEEDPWNSIGAGFLTGGFLQLRTGPRSAAQSAIFGGVLLAMIEGLGIFLNKMTAPPPPPQLMDMTPAGAPSPQQGSTQSIGASLHANANADSPSSSEQPTMPTFSTESPSAEDSGSSGGLWSWIGGGGTKKKEDEIKTKELSGDTFEPQFR